MSVVTVQPSGRASYGELAWRRALRRVMREGEITSPRGMRTRELLGHTIAVDMARAVVTSPTRKLNYKFMCAEALWILDGSNALAPLTRFVKRMAEFSDDGETLAGAYGPRLVPQLPYVIDALTRDRETRQAVATIWTPSPAPSRDIPCTVAVAFSIRAGALHQQVFMRSSDLWLGIPYDIFSFSCWGVCVACALNRRLTADSATGVCGAVEPVALGALTVTAASSHLYERDWAKAAALLKVPARGPTPPCPSDLVAAGRWADLRTDLERQREGETLTGVCQWRVVP